MRIQLRLPEMAEIAPHSGAQSTLFDQLSARSDTSRASRLSENSLRSEKTQQTQQQQRPSPALRGGPAAKEGRQVASKQNAESVQQGSSEETGGARMDLSSRGSIQGRRARTPTLQAPRAAEYSVPLGSSAICLAQPRLERGGRHAGAGAGAGAGRGAGAGAMKPTPVSTGTTAAQGSAPVDVPALHFGPGTGRKSLAKAGVALFHPLHSSHSHSQEGTKSAGGPPGTTQPLFLVCGAEEAATFGSGSLALSSHGR